MPKVHLYRSNIEAARERCSLTPAENAVIQAILVSTDAGSITFEITGLPLQFARALLEDPKLKPNHRAILAMMVYGLREDATDCKTLYPIKVRTPVDFASAFGTHTGNAPNCELFWNSRWYPVNLLVELHEDEHKLARNVSVRVELAMGSSTRTLHWALNPSIFLDDQGSAREITILQTIERLGFRALQTPASHHNLRLLNAERLAADVGHQVWVKSKVMRLSEGRWSSSLLTELPLGTPDMPRRAVIEPALETEPNSGSYFHASRQAVFSTTASKMPLVRCFSFDIKDYVFVDINDLSPYEYDQTALERLYLPPAMKHVLQKVFETPTESLFGDLIRGKHGGIVILACGAPGVGKTLTAEVYAQMSQRPLYVLEFGELGTTVTQIENNLQKVFSRVVRWRAVLQFDECEIFLAKRGLDLERSAIVGIFLRMLDYYEGLLFLTTNQPSALDDAIRSRVMLNLEYPDLDQSARMHIWKTMFHAAGLSLDSNDFTELSQVQLNGRQIRNLARLTRIMHPEGKVTTQNILTLLQYNPQSLHTATGLPDTVQPDSLALSRKRRNQLDDEHPDRQER